MKNTILLSILLFGCASRPMVRPVIQDTFTIDAPYEKTWLALVTAVSGVPIETIDKDSGLLNTKFVYFGAGMGADKEIAQVATIQTGFLLIWTRARYRLNIVARALDEQQTQVRIIADIQGFESNITKNWRRCYSRGILESSIAGHIKKIVAGNK